MKCERCETLDRLGTAAIEKMDNRTFWNRLCLGCLDEIAPVYLEKGGVNITKSYKIIERRGN